MDRSLCCCQTDEKRACPLPRTTLFFLISVRKSVRKFRKTLVINVYCGKTGIRTLGTRKGTTVFETVPFDRSGIFPN